MYVVTHVIRHPPMLGAREASTRIRVKISPLSGETRHCATRFTMNHKRATRGRKTTLRTTTWERTQTEGEMRVHKCTNQIDVGAVEVMIRKSVEEECRRG